MMRRPYVKTEIALEYAFLGDEQYESHWMLQKKSPLDDKGYIYVMDAYKKAIESDDVKKYSIRVVTQVTVIGKETILSSVNDNNH